jgi:hypothetical protein
VEQQPGRRDVAIVLPLVVNSFLYLGVTLF